MKTKKAVLIVERPSKAMGRAFSVLRKPSKKYSNMTILSFPDFETLGRVITGARIELMSVIRAEKPRSIQQLAKLVNRDFKNVYQDVKLLAEFGLIELKTNGPRKSAAPTALYTEFVVAA